MADGLTDIFDMHKAECFGVDKEGGEAFEPSENVDLIVYRDGLVWPGCRLFDGKTRLCMAEKRENNRKPCFRYLAPVKTEVVASHLTECSGIDRDNDYIFEEPEDVLVVAFKNGLVRPLCRVYEPKPKACNAEEDEKEKRQCYRALLPR
jgi:hypothetical protein